MKQTQTEMGDFDANWQAWRLEEQQEENLLNKNRTRTHNVQSNYNNNNNDNSSNSDDDDVDQSFNLVFFSSMQPKSMVIRLVPYNIVQKNEKRTCMHIVKTVANGSCCCCSCNCWYNSSTTSTICSYSFRNWFSLGEANRMLFAQRLQYNRVKNANGLLTACNVYEVRVLWITVKYKSLNSV